MCQTTRHHIAELLKLHQYRCENIKSEIQRGHLRNILFSVTGLGPLGQSISEVNAHRKIDDYANTPPDNEKEITPRNLGIYCMGFCCVVSANKSNVKIF